MNGLEHIKYIYFLGIGGIGMSALAKYFLVNNKEVYGYDKTKSLITDELEELGAKITYVDDAHLIPDVFINNKQESLIVYTPAIPNNSFQKVFFIKNQLKLYKRAEVLGIISKTLPTIAVAGTHGKTTTSTLLAHVLNASSIPVLGILGGISSNYNSNLIFNQNPKYLVTEADEFDRSFLTLHPQIAVITSLDEDHLEIYGTKNELIKSYQEFVRQIKPGGTLITKPQFINHLKVNPDINYITYDLHETADFKTISINNIGDDFFFECNYQQNVISIKNGIPGLHNIENSLAVIAVCSLLGIEPEIVKENISSYKGVKRRFEYVLNTQDVKFIDDYAHHPNELEAFITSIKYMYPNKKIVGIFQPHLYSRTKDFYKEFASSLNNLDTVILLDIYPARELPFEGVSSELIYNELTNNKFLCSKDELLNLLKELEFDVLLTMGAGDIDRLVLPIKQMLSEKQNA